MPFSHWKALSSFFLRNYVFPLFLKKAQLCKPQCICCKQEFSCDRQARLHIQSVIMVLVACVMTAAAFNISIGAVLYILCSQGCALDTSCYSSHSNFRLLWVRKFSRNFLPTLLSSVSVIYCPSSVKQGSVLICFHNNGKHNFQKCSMFNAHVHLTYLSKKCVHSLVTRE